MKKNILFRVVLVVFIFVIGFIIYKTFDLSKFSPEILSSFIEKTGSWGWFFYVLILTILPLLLFPDSIIVIAGGLCFGLLKGILLTSIGSLLGAILAYFIAKYLGKDFVQKLLKGKNLDFTKGSSGFFLVLILRLIPLFPFKIVSYSAGLAEVDFKEFCFATIIGSLPGIIVYTNLGDKVLNIGSNDFYLAIFFLIALTVICLILKKFFENREFTKPSKGSKN